MNQSSSKAFLGKNFPQEISMISRYQNQNLLCIDFFRELFKILMYCELIFLVIRKALSHIKNIESIRKLHRISFKKQFHITIEQIFFKV